MKQIKALTVSLAAKISSVLAENDRVALSEAGLRRVAWRATWEGENGRGRKTEEDKKRRKTTYQVSADSAKQKEG